LQVNLGAIILGLFFMFGLLYKRKFPNLYIYGACQVVLGLGILLSQVRAVILFLAIFILVLGLMHIKRANKVKIRNVLISTALGLVLFVVSGSFIRLINVDRLSYGVEYRYGLIKHALKQYKVVPIAGLGTNQIVNFYDTYTPLTGVLKESSEKDRVFIDSTHNIFVDYWLQYGLIGFSSFLLLVLLAMYAGVKNWKKNQLVKFLFISLIYLVSQLSVTITKPEVEFLLWLFIFMQLYQCRNDFGKFGKDLKISKLNKMLFVVFLSVLIPVIILIDNNIASNRLALALVFPLDTSKEVIKNGSTFNDTQLVWEYDMRKNMHHDYNAVDIFAEEGTKVVAVGPGKVVYIREGDCKSEGQFPVIQVKGLDGFYYLYSHLSPQSIHVVVGDAVQAGDLLAKVGSSACADSSASHLHLDISRMLNTNRMALQAKFLLIDPQAAMVDSYRALPEN